MSAGKQAEEHAARELARRGYRIVTRNYRGPAGEIDIIAKHGRALVFVEVRSRASARHGDAIETINRAKRRRIARTAAHYLAAHRVRYSEIRFDVVGITDGTLTLLQDAFRTDD